MTSDSLARLLDDASQFPPGDLSLERAVGQHARWRRGDESAVIGRFMVPIDRAARFATLIDGDAPHFEVGLVVKPGLRTAQAVAAVREAVNVLDSGATIGSVELPVMPEARIGLERVVEAVPHAWIFIERADLDDVANLRARGFRVGAKLRCGGLAPSDFPTADRVAELVRGCVSRRLPFKATAGLHRPVRHYDTNLQTWQHGFLNLWMATALAMAGAEQDDVRACLMIDRADELLGLGVADAELKAARLWFTGFGTCSIEEPLAHLEALGLFRDA